MAVKIGRVVAHFRNADGGRGGRARSGRRSRSGPLDRVGGAMRVRRADCGRGLMRVANAFWCRRASIR